MRIDGVRVATPPRVRLQPPKPKHLGAPALIARRTGTGRRSPHIMLSSSPVIKWKTYGQPFAPGRHGFRREGAGFGISGSVSVIWTYAPEAVSVRRSARCSEQHGDCSECRQTCDRLSRDFLSEAWIGIGLRLLRLRLNKSSLPQRL